MILANKRLRTLVLGIILCLLGFAVWLQLVYMPMAQEISSANAETESLVSSLEMLKLDKQKLVRLKKVNSGKKKELERLSSLMIDGGSLQEANATTQMLMQKFWESHKLTLTTYKELKPGKWRENRVGMVVYHFSCGIQDLSDLLIYTDSLKKVVKIAKISIHCANRKKSVLKIVLTLGTLFVETM
jgi:hypothetical protein